MDSLIADEDALGLNIVCINDAGTGSSSTNAAAQKARKPKKKNKYEKRRAKAQRAKQLKQSSVGGKNEIEANTSTNDLPLKGGKEQGHSNNNTNNIPSGASKDDDVANTNGTTTNDITRSTNQDTKNNDTENSTVEKKNPGPEMMIYRSKNSRKSQNNKNEVNTTSTTAISTEAIKCFDSATSRKKQQLRTEELLKDEARRAEYMSTYHARPYEMDRKSGAVSKIHESKESTHIFDSDDDDDDEKDSDNDDSDVEKTNENTNNPFAGCGIHPKIINAISSERGMNLKRPTIIQRNAWDQILMRKNRRDNTKIASRNLLVQSETGSGKTLAYLLPIVQRLAIDTQTWQPKKVDRQIGGTRAIILCPTRELATQTSITCEKVCLHSFPWLVPGCLSGGEKRKSEKARLRKGITILVATPGRLLDHLAKTDSLLMALKGKLEWVVLDESDRLLDLGLGSQVEQIIQMVRSNQPKSGLKRDGITWQSILVSATINDKVKKMATKLLGGDTWVWARARASKGEHEFQDNGEELSNATPKQLTQHHVVVSSKLRLTALLAFLTTRVVKKERIVVFMSTCDGVDFHHKLFKGMQSITSREKDSTAVDQSKSKSGIFGKSCSMYRLHGNIPHKERHEIMSQFTNTQNKSAKSSILITTDVAARGLNLPAVDWIVQYDPPCETADYIHRAGRAARAGKAGHALLFLLPSELQYVEVLKLKGLSKLTALSLSAMFESAAKICEDVTAEGLNKTFPSHGKASRDGEAFTGALQLRLEDQIVNDDNDYKEALLKKALPSGSDKEQRRKQRREAKKAVGPLLESATKAFSSYIRGYATKEKCVKHIFSARALHLGHVAKSFALREQPKNLMRAHRNAKLNDDHHSSTTKRNHQLAFGSNEKHIEPNEQEATTLENENHMNLNIARSVKASMLNAALRIEGGEMEFF